MRSVDPLPRHPCRRPVRLCRGRGRVERRHPPAEAFLLAALLAAASGLVAPAAGAAEPATAAGEAWFEEVAEAAGVAVPHRNRSFDNPYAHIMEGYTALGAAVAVADFDGDGFEDLFVTDSSEAGRNLLYRNDGDLTFTEVGEAAGVAAGNDATNASANALWLDYDDDGDPDLLVVRFGRNLLYENLGPDAGGGVRFRDVTAAAGIGDRYLNAIAAIAFDYDLDSDLDLFLANYFAPVDLFDPDTPRFFPESFETAANGGGVTLYRNLGPDASGQVRFADATEAAGLAAFTGWALDLGHADADLDGDDDLYVAADFGTDAFFLNNGDGTFADVTESAIGIDTKKGMNADWGDYDGDGLFDVYVTNITDEYMREGNFLWRNNGVGPDGALTFIDVARETGTYDTGWGWAGKFFDYDNDGWLDLYVVNGWVSGNEENYVLDIFELIVRPDVDLADARNWPPMGEKTLSGYQRNHLFHNQEGMLFADVGARHGLDRQADGRGVAVADFDRDGRQDMFITNAGSVPFLFRNTQPTGAHWVGFELAGRQSNRDAVGAVLELTAGGRTRLSFVNGGNGFASQSSRRVYFGLGAVEKTDRLEVRWPSGATQTFAAVGVDTLWRITEGEAELVPLAGAGAQAGAAAAAGAAALGTAADELFQRGMAAVAAGDGETALDLLEAAAGAAPDNLRYGAEYRQAVIALEEYDRAIDFFGALVEKHPDAYAALMNLGYALVDKIPAVGAITQVILANTALGHFTEAIEAEETWLGRYTRGNSYVYWPKIFGRTQLAIADLERAIEIAEDLPQRPYHARAWAALGDAYWRLEKPETMRRIWRDGLERYPGDPELEERLAMDDAELDRFLGELYATGTRVPTHLRELWAQGGAS